MNTIITLVVILVAIAVVWILLNKSTAKLKIPNLKLPKFSFQKKKNSKAKQREGGDLLTFLIMKLILWTTVGTGSDKLIFGKYVSKSKTPGIGRTWNGIIVPFINAIPGLFLAFVTLTAIFLFGYLFNFPKSFMNFATHIYIWIPIFIYFGVQAYKKYNKEVSVKELTLARLEYKGEGIVVKEQVISDRAEKNVNTNFKLDVYAMLPEGEWNLPWFSGISSVCVPSKNVPKQFTTNKISTRSANGIQIGCIFIERYQTLIPGLYFSVAGKNEKSDELKKATLENAVIDLIQKLDAQTLLNLSGKQIKKILLEEFSNENGNIREIIKKSKEEDYHENKNLHGAQKVIQDWYVAKKMIIDAKYGAKAKKLIPAEDLEKFKKDEEKERLQLSQDFIKFKEAIIGSVGKVKSANDKIGVYTDDIVQKEMNYDSNEAKNAAEQEMITMMQNQAKQLELDWLTNATNQLVESWKDGTITANAALRAIQVQFGDRIGYSFDGDQADKLNLIINPNDNKKKNN